MRKIILVGSTENVDKLIAELDQDTAAIRTNAAAPAELTIPLGYRSFSYVFNKEEFSLIHLSNTKADDKQFIHSSTMESSCRGAALYIICDKNESTIEILSRYARSAGSFSYVAAKENNESVDFRTLISNAKDDTAAIINPAETITPSFVHEGTLKWDTARFFGGLHARLKMATARKPSAQPINTPSLDG